MRYTAERCNEQRAATGVGLDWMVLQADGVLINRAWVSKLGIGIGSVSLFFSKLEAR